MYTVKHIQVCQLWFSKRATSTVAFRLMFNTSYEQSQWPPENSVQSHMGHATTLVS